MLCREMQTLLLQLIANIPCLFIPCGTCQPDIDTIIKMPVKCLKEEISIPPPPSLFGAATPFYTFLKLEGTKLLTQLLLFGAVTHSPLLLHFLDYYYSNLIVRACQLERHLSLEVTF